MENRDYFPIVEEFLRDIQTSKVKCIAAVALLDDPDYRDTVCVYNCSPHEMVACAGVLQLHASYEYLHLNDDAEDEEDE